MNLPAWAVGSAAVLMAAALIICLPVEFRVRLCLFGPARGNQIVFEIGFLGRYTVWRLSLPLSRLVRGRRERPAPAPPAGSSRLDLADLALRLARETRWSRLDWTTTVGARDAAATALATGALWMLKGHLAALARSRLNLRPGLPRLEVRPDFAQSGLETRVDGIGVLRVGHIIIALVRALGGTKRSPKAEAQSDRPGRRSGWLNTPSKA